VRKDGKLEEAYVQKNTVVTEYLTVLNCQLSEANVLQKVFPLHLVILPDAVDAEPYRQLRVWLRWEKLESVKP
jgi:toxin CptA